MVRCLEAAHRLPFILSSIPRRMKSFPAVFLSFLCLVNIGRTSPIDNCSLVPEKYEACMAALIRLNNGDCMKLCENDHQCSRSCYKAKILIYGSADATFPPLNEILPGTEMPDLSTTSALGNTKNPFARDVDSNPLRISLDALRSGHGSGSSIDDCLKVPEKSVACIVSLIKQNNGDCKKLCGNNIMCEMNCFDIMNSGLLDVTTSSKTEISLGSAASDSSITSILQSSHGPSAKPVEMNSPKRTAATSGNGQKSSANPVEKYPPKVTPSAMGNGQKTSPKPIEGNPPKVTPADVDNGQKPSTKSTERNLSKATPSAFNNSQKPSAKPVEKDPLKVTLAALDNGRKTSSKPMQVNTTKLTPSALSNSQKSTAKPTEMSPSKVTPAIPQDSQEPSERPVQMISSKMTAVVLENNQGPSAKPVEMNPSKVTPAALGNSHGPFSKPVEINPLKGTSGVLQNSQEASVKPMDTKPSKVTPAILQNSHEPSGGPVDGPPNDSSGIPTPPAGVQDVTSFAPGGSGETPQSLDITSKLDATVHNVVNSVAASADPGALGVNKTTSEPKGDTYGTQDINSRPSIAPTLSNALTLHFDSSEGSDGASKESGEDILLPGNSTSAFSSGGDASTNTSNEPMTIQGVSQEVPLYESFSDVSHALATEVPPSLSGTDGQSPGLPQKEALL
ncbi:hypothetical protein ANCCAN_18697 [Ancylostoma caninum]|uniref:Uncharacterized protein n=1 Tax=Ancylostoma caninum TaxID=29170 RepID=A0A368FWS9_ANCCA|nr:hypothetical protein ANCCAN_18697 [Ancylostoma caninum]